MALTEETIRQMAQLSRLRPAPADVPQLLRDVSAILAFFEQLEAADTAGVEPLAHPRDDVQRLRTDAVTEDDRREQYQALAAEVRDGLYRVPPVLDVD